jgi:hypothetical protein
MKNRQMIKELLKEKMQIVGYEHMESYKICDDDFVSIENFDS